MSRFVKVWAFLSVPFLFALAPTAYGQSTRTWVSGVGDDANPCSRTAPCKTFAGAISKTAAGGEINAIDPGGFGAVTITKAITIDTTPVEGGVLVAGTAGIVVNAGANDVVVLRGLDFNGTGTGTKGIQIIQAGKVLIEDCQISEFTPRGISVEPASSPVQVFVSRTRIIGSASNGIVVQPASASIATQVTLNQVDISQNANFGISITGGSSISIRDSILSNNGLETGLANIRVDATTGAATLDLDNVQVSGSTTGIFAVNGAVVRVNNSSIIQNTTGLSTSGSASILTFGNNRLAGNGTNGAFTGTVALQ